MASTADTGMTAAEQYPVYVGIWTNWSRGRVMGTTITLKQADANLLIAFVAFFIAFVATRFWRILCFVLHRAYSTAGPQDALYHQCQAILRNSYSPEDGMRLLIRSLHASRYSKKRFRPILAIFTAILCIFSFTIAGGFSSRISTAIGNEVLVKSINCGYDVKEDETDTAFTAYKASQSANAANYAQQCYSSDGTGVLDCGRFIREALAPQIDMAADCPFEDGMCRNQSSNIRLDTGYLDSHKDLGLNTPVDQRFLSKYVLHCAPLVTEGFTRQGTASIGNLTYYTYGPFRMGVNYTYAARSVESQYAVTKSSDALTTSADYQLEFYHVAVVDGSPYLRVSDFVPIDPLFRNDADISLVFLLAGGVQYYEPVEDEWYRTEATAEEIPVMIGDNLSTTPWEIYLPSQPASPLGCAEQYQFCRNDEENCGPLASLHDAVAGVAPLFNSSYENWQEDKATTLQEAYFVYFFDAFLQSPRKLEAILQHLGSKALQSRKTLSYGAQGPLPHNQWQLDVINWFNVSNAATQAGYLDIVYGPTANTDSGIRRFLWDTPELQNICSSQKIRSTAYASFSAFGLCFTASLGLLITLVSYSLEPLSSFLHKKGRINQHSHLEWTTNATLQLQRLAHEELGFGTWTKATNEVPAAGTDELLACLDITDPKHPILQQKLDSDSTPSITQATGEPAEATPPADKTQRMDPLDQPTHSIQRPESLQSVSTETHALTRTSDEILAELDFALDGTVDPRPATESVTIPRNNSQPTR